MRHKEDNQTVRVMIRKFHILLLDIRIILYASFGGLAP